MQYKLGFIGCGNMGGALVSAAAKKVIGNQIAVCDYDEEKTARLRKAYGVKVTAAEDLAQNADFVILGVKPQVIEQAVAPLADILRARKNVTVVTMAAGVSIAGLKDMLGGEIPVIRIMPNTPVSVGEGMILYAADGASETQINAFLDSFSAAGKFDELDESLIDAGCALSGSGPAFVYAFAEALIKGATACGIPPEKATEYAAQTIKGAAEMMLQHGDPAPLRRAVCSPGGTTLAGLEKMEKENFSASATAGVRAAYDRALELKK